MIQLLVSIILFFVMFFGISFILNMLIRRTWVMAIAYPVIVLLIVSKVPFAEYFKNPGYAFTEGYTALMNITPIDIIILTSGFAGTIVSGIVIKMLRNRGYQMF